MALSQSIKGLGKNMLLAGSLVALLSSTGKGTDLWQISGTVESEKRSETWYQVTVKDPSMKFVTYKDDLKIRFYSNTFDIKDLDQKIKPGTKLSVTAEEVLGRDRDYELLAIGVDKIENP